MKIKSTLRKENVDERFIKLVLMSNLTWEEKIALRYVVRKITSKEGVKKLLKRKKVVEVEFDEHPLSMVMTGITGLTHNIIITDTAGVEHEWRRTTPLFEDEVEYNTEWWIGFMSHNFKKYSDEAGKLKASLRTYYNEKRREGVKGFERKPTNF